MTVRRTGLIASIAVATLTFVSASAANITAAQLGIPAHSIVSLNKQYSKRLLPEQARVLAEDYPDFQVVDLCSGHFSGADAHELVLAVLSSARKGSRIKWNVHRIGLIRDRSKWVVHNIDKELQLDADISRSLPMHWTYALTNNDFASYFQCGLDLKTDKQIGVLGDKPFFDRTKLGLQENTVVCFGTSSTYNNWDCVIYSPKDDRFRLWFQQAHAD